jgi:hypothetical protein
MDKPNCKSFASLVYDKLRKYKLPDLMDLMENPIEKHKWKLDNVRSSMVHDFNAI